MDINSVHKDKSQNYLVQLHQQSYNNLIEIIKRDSEFLASLKIMDYSLLLVQESIDKDTIIHQGHGSINKEEDEFKINRNQIRASDKGTIYHVGIIDFLQVWDRSKKIE